MKKALATLLSLVMIAAMLPTVTFAASTELTAVRAGSFNSAAEWLPNASDSSGRTDSFLVASNGTDNWQGVKTFTDTDGAVTNMASVSGTGFATPRNGVIAFTLPESINVDAIRTVTLSMTIKNVKQVTANNRLSIYGNSVAGTWAANEDKATFGASASDAGLSKLMLLGLTDAITAGNQNGLVTSGQTVSLSSKALADYFKEIYKSGDYSEITFRVATTLGGIEVYAPEVSSYPPTLTIETSSNVDFTIHYYDYSVDGDMIDPLAVNGAWADEEYILSEEEMPYLVQRSDAVYILDENASPRTFMPSESNTECYAIYAPVDSVLAEYETVAYLGAKPELPSSIKVTFTTSGEFIDEKIEKTYPVTWNEDEYNAAINDAGVHSISGYLTNYPFVKALCTLEMKEFTPDESVIANSGGWNWYAEPSGTHIQPHDALAERFLTYSTGGYEFVHDRTFMGWCKDDGTVEIAQYDHDTHEYTVVVLHEKLEADDHNNPAVVILPDGRVMAWYSMHTNEPYMYYRVSKYPEDISEWNEEQYYYCDTDNGGSISTYNATYPTIFLVKGEPDEIYMFWRGVHWQPTMARFTMPDEEGKCDVIVGQTQIVNSSVGSLYDGGAANGGLRPYAKYDYDYEHNKIHITYTYTHPDNVSGDDSIGRRNPIYYMYLNIADQKFYTPHGSYIMDVPENNSSSYGSFTNGGVTVGNRWGVIVQNAIGRFPSMLVFDPAKNTQRRGWTWDIKGNEAGEPCIVYADVTDNAPNADGSAPSSYFDVADADRCHHYYYYARWDDEAQEWKTTFLTYGGKWFHENTTQERCYSGGVTLDHNYSDANVIYLAIPTMGEYGNMFEIYRWESDDNGATWTKREPLTQNSKINNARPNVIYNYKQNDDGTHGPRVLWMRGEYRYWMNYEYETGIMTDFLGIKAQDDPHMKADAELYDAASGEKVEALTPEMAEAGVRARFTISNISPGEGEVRVMLAHYRGGELVGTVSDTVTVPGRSIPLIAVLGTPKMANGEAAPMGSEEIITELDYAPESFEEGDSIKLMAWTAGEDGLSPIASIPYEMTTAGDRYLMRDSFTADDEYVFTGGDEWNGWTAYSNIQNTNYTPSFGTKNYAAITRAPFGNTALHIYHGTSSTTTGNADGAGAILVSHALPEVDDDYVIRFNVRWINELQWQHVAYNGFSLSHGVPTGHTDMSTNSICAWQMRYVGRDSGTNGRRGYYISYDTTDFFQGSEHNRIDYVEGINGNNSDRILEGAQIEVKLIVRPNDKKIEYYMSDGYRTGSWVQDYNTLNANGSTITDWSDIKINNITFNSGIGYKGELFIDDFRVYLLGDEKEIEAIEGEQLEIAGIIPSQDVNNNAENAIDGDAATYWHCASTNEDQTPEYIADLGGVFTLTKVGVTTRTYSDSRSLKYDVYVSDDGENWTRIFRGTSPSNGGTNEHDARLLKARFVKVRMNGSGVNKEFDLAELTVFGLK